MEGTFKTVHNFLAAKCINVIIHIVCPGEMYVMENGIVHKEKKNIFTVFAAMALFINPCSNAITKSFKAYH